MKAVSKESRWSAIAVAVMLAAVGGVSANQVALNVSMGNPVLLADKKQTTYIKVGLTGFEMQAAVERTPVNVGIVLDKSGSMQGEKIQRAKEAALMAIEKLTQRDIVSLVAYDSTVSVLVPATRASDRVQVRQGVQRLRAGGSTALFAGVCKGAEEVRKFLDRNRVNRIILLSDGLANVGPDSPGALAELGDSLGKEGISVTTIGLGLGYNEDLMTRLAQKSDGNHAFVEDSKNLARIFNYEFGDVLSVVAQEVVVRIRCRPGVRPVRVLNREADIAGQQVVASINQLYASQEKYLMLEVEVPAGEAGSALPVADVDVSYANMSTRTTDELSSRVAVRFTDRVDVAESSQNRGVLVAAALQVATERNELAVRLRDEGKLEEARRLLISNAGALDSQAKALGSKELSDYSELNREDSANLKDEEWGGRRKSMREVQHRNRVQQVW